MKYLFPITLLVICMSCSQQRIIQSDVNKATFVSPEIFPPEDRKELYHTYQRGFGMYKAACAGSGCHGASLTGNDTIPHFTAMELDEYDKAVQNNDPDNHAVAAKLSPEQLNDILTFLFLRTLARNDK